MSDRFNKQGYQLHSLTLKDQQATRSLLAGLKEKICCDRLRYHPIFKNPEKGSIED
ncbi:hypothetical protein [Tolypothrix sp. NIES-4075]|uniref:hypothetical protein n=1 Tax=Tolypothrix sp. NIES-4075 TaxID=2005459 RepID=UPI00135B28E3|nr:hypothetical protein [Tolypothrix sp. NIES-4075]